MLLAPAAAATILTYSSCRHLQPAISMVTCSSSPEELGQQYLKLPPSPHPTIYIQVWNFPSALCLSVSCFVCVIGRWWWVGGTLRAGGAKVQGPMAVVHYCDCSGSPAEPGGLPDNLIIPQFPPPGSLQNAMCTDQTGLEITSN